MGLGQAAPCTSINHRLLIIHPRLHAPRPIHPAGANVTFKQFLVSNLIPVTLGNIVAGTVSRFGSFSHMSVHTDQPRGLGAQRVNEAGWAGPVKLGMRVQALSSQSVRTLVGSFAP